MKNFKKLIKEALTPDFLTEYNQTQGREEYRDMDFEVLYSPEDGYNIEAERYEIVNPNAYFSTYAEAVEHAELEIDGYLGEWEEDDDLLDDYNDDWVEDPNWAKLEENMALSKELENHPDFDILVTTLEDSLGIEIERSLRSGKYNGREGYYLRTPDVNTWTENAKEMITQALDTASAKAQDHTFEFEGVSDYELEPGERSWDASIEFFINREESVNEDQKSVDSYIKKWNDKMKGSSRSTAKDWVDGIKGISKEDKESILKGIKESVNETIKKGDKFTSDDYGKTINWWVVKQDGGAIELDNDHPRYSRFALSVKDFEKKVKNGEFKSINEMDMNDPVLMGMRASKQSMDTDPTSTIDYDEALSLRQLKAELLDQHKQLFRDMEQEAEPEGGPIADRYGAELEALENRIYKIGKQLMDYDMNESLNEDEDEYVSIFHYYDKLNKDTKDKKSKDKVSASSIPEGPQRLKWYGKGLAKMMTPYDTEGPEGLLNDLLDNPEDFPLHWNVAHAGTVDYMQDNFDIIVKYANDELGMLESVNEDDLDVNYSDADAGDESIEKESASGAYESKKFDFKKMIKEALTPDYLKK
jgi:hypothetical protein